jgi:predicted Mrr-cat superfamily restriction endonuclease
MNAFVVRLDTRLEEAFETSTIGIGWEDVRTFHTEMSWQELKAYLESCYGEQVGARALGNWAGSIWRFFCEMQVGDLAVVPAGDVFHISRISGAPFFEKNDRTGDFKWRRSVEWERRNIPRSFATNSLQRRLKARQTVIAAGDLLEDIEAARKATRAVSFGDKIEEKVAAEILVQLRSAGNDRDLEDLVLQLTEAQGATARILPKRQDGDGDFDVIARFPLFAAPLTSRPTGGSEQRAKGGAEEEFVVAYQVKQHEGQTDAHAVRQLLDARDREGSAEQPDRLVVCSTADSFSDEAVALAEAEGVILVCGLDFARWVLHAGLASVRRGHLE